MYILLLFVAIVADCRSVHVDSGALPAEVKEGDCGWGHHDGLLEYTNYTAELGQLDVPLGPCHIKILDLPKQYQQQPSEARVNGHVSDARFNELKAKYPILIDCWGLEREWESPDGQTIAFLLWDPLGEFLLLSRNGGGYWPPPIYLGEHRLPKAWYATLSDSKLPLIADGKVQIEVSIWKIDESKPGGLLMGHQYLWKKWNKYLSIPLDAVLKDSDHDGLSDLFEERILTNPHSADTDADGLNDGVDNQPLTPFPAKWSTVDDLALTLIREPAFGWMDVPEGLTASNSKTWQDEFTQEGRDYFTRPQNVFIPSRKTTLIAAEGNIFARITGVYRTIVLNQHAQEKYAKKFPEEMGFNFHAVDLWLFPSKRTVKVEEFHLNQGHAYILWQGKDGWIKNSGEIMIIME